MIIAGIGSRSTPANNLSEIGLVSSWCRHRGIWIRSGHADGADKAFEKEADPDRLVVFLPWRNYNREGPARGTVVVTRWTPELAAVVNRIHPTPGLLSRGAALMMARNAQIILGANLDTPVNAVVCWTPDEERGGTSFGIRLAREHGIPVFNLNRMGPAAILQQLGAIADAQVHG